jgi:hypothetical protein
MAGPNWIPVAVLPNLYTRRTVEGEIVALVPPSDVRVTTFASEHPMLGAFLARFTDTFYVPLEPVVFIVRDDAIPKLNDTQGALLSFRDLVALSVVPHARSNGLVYGGTDRISYANSFWLHPWMVESDRLIASTPAFSGFHVVQDFHGQSSPELPLMQLSELDEPLFAALLTRWKRHYLRKRQRWQDRALFRSLNMAYQAAQLPAGKGPTLYDLGRTAALWVSAFEILAHPRVDSSGLKYVYALFDRVTYLDRKVRRKKYAAYMARAKKPWPRRTLPCWLYGRLYRGRNAFLHGNPVGPKTLQPGDLKVSLFWLAPCLFRLALTGALDLSFKKELPKGATAEQTGEFASARMDFDDYQMIAERALLRARK